MSSPRTSSEASPPRVLLRSERRVAQTEAEAAAVSFQISPSGNPYLAKLSSYIATQYPGDVGSL
jgi:hypothetical protein